MMSATLASATSPERTSGTENNKTSTLLRPNPRRTPPRDSVSLPGHKRQKLGHSPSTTNAVVATPSKTPVRTQRSQESGSDESATHWFDNVNQHVGKSRQGAAGYDGMQSQSIPVPNDNKLIYPSDEPPFYIGNQRNYIPGQFATSESSRPFGGTGGLSRLDSENEDLRGVIDDLTIENKRLKQILRTHRSRRNSPSTDSQDKLFEVRMHGLPPEKRRELEYLLKNFATSVHTSAPSLTASISGGSGVSSSSLTGNKAQKTDSGYASNSNSAQATYNPSFGGRALPNDPSRSSKDKSIKSYLHDIPDTLMPRQQPIVMSDRAKMALVVRRLEQLFTGKRAAPGEHSQPMQQQEVSQSAARADAKNNNRKSKTEGTREAHILPPESKFNFDLIDAVPEKRKHSTLEKGDSTATDNYPSSVSRPGSPDQRPTRPLDLDIHRAQVAAENIEYIRHLGLSIPEIDLNDPSRTMAMGTDWIYLNLLVNMAQLHTINVTPEFVRRAVKKLSTKFELSKDGHRVRWVGGPDGTVFSKEEEKALEAVDNSHTSPDESTEDAGTGGSSKRSKTDSTSNAVVSNTASDERNSGLQTSSGSKQQISTGATSQLQSTHVTKNSRTGTSFDYKPIVYREKPRDAEEALLQDSDSSHDSWSRDSGGLAQALSKSNLNQQRVPDEGLITFFNNPHFCSDYSGDHTPVNMSKDREVAEGYVVGIPYHVSHLESPLRYGDACYFTPQFGPAPLHAPKDERTLSMDVLPIHAVGEEETQPKELAVSGVGGVIPDDNFALDVKHAMSPVKDPSTSSIIRINPLTGTKVGAHFTLEGISCRKIQLLPSRLPPPSYVFFTSSSSSGNPDIEDSDDDSSETSSSASSEHPAPAAFLQHWSTENSGEERDMEDDDLESSSVDMLAMARAADPVTIAEQERQYMINQPGGRAVAGSLAATVGASRSSSSADEIASDVGDVASDMEFDSDEE